MDSLRQKLKKTNSKLILKSWQRFRREKHNVFTAKVNRFALSANNDKRIQSVDSIKTYACGTNIEIIHKKLLNYNT